MNNTKNNLINATIVASALSALPLMFGLALSTSSYGGGLAWYKIAAQVAIFTFVIVFGLSHFKVVK